MRRASAVQAMEKLVGAAMGRRGIDAAKCAEALARACDADGDAAAAQAIRDVVAAAPKVALFGATSGRGTDLVTWHDPVDLSAELVLDGGTGASLERLATELQQAHRFIAAGVDAPTRVLFSGPSGTGKTLAARWLGGRLGIPVGVVKLSAVVEGFMGATSANLHKAFAEAHGAPSILFLDEIDGICGRRNAGAGRDVEEQARITSALLQLLDAAPPEQIVVAATNFVEKVDPALVRRLPTTVVFELPCDRAREAMLRRWLARVPHDAATLFMAVEATRGRSGAEARALAMAAGRAAILDGTGVLIDHVAAAAEAMRREPREQP